VAYSPLIPGFYSDPSICHGPDGYFLVTSSFEYFPGVPLFHSPDLNNWRPIGHVLDRVSQLDLDKVWLSGGIYAPTIRYHDGVYYLITTKCGGPEPSGNFVVATRDPFGDWSDPIWLPEAAGIDPDLFWDVDGTCYLQWSLRRKKPSTDICIGQAACDPGSGALLETPRELWRGTGGHGPEGPHLFRIGEYYYLLIAEGGTEYGHMQTLARSRSPRGPWEPCPHNPVLTHRSSGSAIQAVGHADLVQAADESWLGVCHGIRPKGYHKFHVLGRETFCFPVTWRPDEWPILGENGMLPDKPVTIEGRTVVPMPARFQDDFTGHSYPADWNWLRHPRLDAYARPGDGTLRLSGHSDALNTHHQPTWLGVRQRMHRCCVRANLRFYFESDRAEAGLTIYQNHRHHVCIGVKRLPEGLRVFSRIALGAILVEENGPWLNEGSKELVVCADDLNYTLGLLQDNGTFEPLQSCEARFLSTEVSGRFTGVYFALFATGKCDLICHHFLVHEGDFDESLMIDGDSR